MTVLYHYITRMLSNALLNFMLCFVTRPLQKPPLYNITALYMILFYSNTYRDVNKYALANLLLYIYMYVYTSEEGWGGGRGRLHGEFWRDKFFICLNFHCNLYGIQQTLYSLYSPSSKPNEECFSPLMICRGCLSLLWDIRLFFSQMIYRGWVSLSWDTDIVFSLYEIWRLFFIPFKKY